MRALYDMRLCCLLVVLPAAAFQWQPGLPLRRRAARALGSTLTEPSEAEIVDVEAALDRVYSELEYDTESRRRVASISAARKMLGRAPRDDDEARARDATRDAPSLSWRAARGDVARA